MNMNVILTIKDFISAYWGLLPMLFILITIGLLKIPFVKQMWDRPQNNNATSDEQAAKDKLRNEFNLVLRELRAEVNDFISAIEDIKQGRSTIQTLAKYFTKTNQDIQELFVEINKLNKDFHSDKIRHINNYWEHMQYNPILMNPGQAIDAQDQLHQLSNLETQAKKMILAIGLLTIPYSVNRWLADSRPGYYLPFHLLYVDEMPSAEDRQKVINTIAWAPSVVESGIVNAQTGLIYRYDPDKAGQWRSFLVILLATYIATAGVWFVGEMGYINIDTASMDAKTLLIAWFAVLTGMFIHITTEKFKRSKATGLPQIVATSDWLIYFSAHKGDILLKLLMALFGLFGFIFSSDIVSVTMISSFLVGYSLDSFIGLFSSTLEQKAEAHYSAMNKNMGG